MESATEWINGNQAKVKLGINPARLYRQVALGRIRAKIEPGVTPLYCLADVERFARETSATTQTT